MKKILFVLIIMVMVLFAGCSSNEPKIREIEVQNKKLEGDTFFFNIVVKVAVDKSPEVATSYIVKLSSLTDSTYTREKEGGFVEGMFNSNVVFDQKYTKYADQELGYKLELIQGTKVLDSKIIKFKYEE